VLDIVRQIDDGRTSPPKFPFDTVAAGKRIIQLIEEIRHPNLGNLIPTLLVVADRRGEPLSS